MGSDKIYTNFHIFLPSCLIPAFMSVIVSLKSIRRKELCPM